MSAVAGLIDFSGSPTAETRVQVMLGALAHRGPDGRGIWRGGQVALGQCMARTTPESLAEVQPLIDATRNLVLVMDGRIDNRDELCRMARGAGLVPRDDTDAELALCAYAAWGNACAARISGEFVLFVWDGLQQRLFGARDAVGVRHVYYHAGSSRFAFASEIKGILALADFPPRLNDMRVLDYLIDRFDRNDQVGTFYQDVLRLPAGHCIEVVGPRVRTWRYWHPELLPPRRFASPNDCAEEYLWLLQTAVRSGLRTSVPVGSTLSGGLDSSSIVAVVCTDYPALLKGPLPTFSLVLRDRTACRDWAHIQVMLGAFPLTPTIIDSTAGAAECRRRLERLGQIDEPFQLTHGLPNSLVYRSAAEQGCRVLLEGMAGDLHFYSPGRSLQAVFRQRAHRLIAKVMASGRTHNLHGMGGVLGTLLLSAAAPRLLRPAYRRLRVLLDSRSPELEVLRKPLRKALLIRQRGLAAPMPRAGVSDRDIEAHAWHFTGGMVSFAHEVYGIQAWQHGVELRSPFSDRRLVEFALQMPLEAKLCAPWYKGTLRRATRSRLPPAVLWRTDIGSHPGHEYYRDSAGELSRYTSRVSDEGKLIPPLLRWLQADGLGDRIRRFVNGQDTSSGVLALVWLAYWRAVNAGVE